MCVCIALHLEAPRAEQSPHHHRNPLVGSIEADLFIPAFPWITFPLSCSLGIPVRCGLVIHSFGVFICICIAWAIDQRVLWRINGITGERGG